MVIASDCVGLTLPGMIELPGSFSGIEISPMPQRGPLASHRTSLAILVSEAASVFKRAVGIQQRVVRRERLEFVTRRNERESGRLSQLPRHARAEFGMGVESGAYRGAAQGELAQVG